MISKGIVDLVKTKQAIVGWHDGTQGATLDSYS
jgi:hypothetical protein